MLDLLIQYIVMPAVGALLLKIFGADVLGKVKKYATKIMTDPTDPITSPREALKKAMDAVYAEYMEEHVADLERLQAQGKLDATDALARGRADAPPPENVTLVPLDGSEKPMKWPP